MLLMISQCHHREGRQEDACVSGYFLEQTLKYFLPPFKLSWYCSYFIDGRDEKNELLNLQVNHYFMLTANAGLLRPEQTHTDCSWASFPPFSPRYFLLIVASLFPLTQCWDVAVFLPSRPETAVFCDALNGVRRPDWASLWRGCDSVSWLVFCISTEAPLSVTEPCPETLNFWPHPQPHGIFMIQIHSCFLCSQKSLLCNALNLLTGV